MARYENNQQVTIDEEAANRDIQKIQQALPSLQAAQAALERVREAGSQTQGLTGAAVADKSGELIVRIQRLVQNLEDTQILLRQTVLKYQVIDEVLAADVKWIGNGGI